MRAKHRFSSGKIIRHFSYMPLLMIAAGLLFVKLLAYAHWMDVDEFGLLAKYLVLSSIIAIVGSMGFHVLANRRVPALLHKDHEGAALLEIMRSGSATIITGVVVALCLSIAALSGIIPGSLWVYALLLGLLNHLFLIFTIESKGRLQMFRYASMVLVRGLVVVGLGVTAAIYWGNVDSVLFAEIIGTLIVLLLVSISIIANIQPETRLDIARKVNCSVKVVLPRNMDWYRAFMVLIATIAMLVSINLDRWLAVGIMPAQEFGIYAFVWIIMTGAQSVQQIVNAGFFPVVARAVAGKGAHNGLLITGIGSLGVLVVASIVGAMFTILAPRFVQTYYPAYVSALNILPLFIIIAILRVSDFWTSFLIIVEQESILIKVQITAMFLVVVVWCGWVIIYTNLDWLTRFAALAALLAIVSYCTSFFISITSARRIV